MRRARQGAVAAAIVCVALAVGASPAAALTQGQANVLAVRKLDPQQWAGNVVLFGLPAPVPGGRTVTAWSLWPGRHAMPAVRLKDSNWLYWEDFAYEGEFAHPSELLLINNRTGATREMFLDMVPLVNGRRTAFDSGEPGYRSPSDMLYTSIAPPPPSPSGGFETPLTADRRPRATRSVTRTPPRASTRWTPGGSTRV